MFVLRFNDLVDPDHGRVKFRESILT
jgi:hypothetical protein